MRCTILAQSIHFVIAHRSSTVRNADLILMLDQGQLVEQGKFDELVALGGLFASRAEQGKFSADALDAIEVVAAIDAAVNEAQTGER